MDEAKPVLVTGVAGFIGFHLARRLLDEGRRVVGIDNLNDYYDVNLKQARLNQIIEHPGFDFHKLDIADRQTMEAFFGEGEYDLVLHMAAQAGVRYSLENPQAYVDSNLVGFANILEGCRHRQVKHLVFASSSSVYGANTKVPFSESDNVDHPVSLYAATKKANELMAHSYAHLYGLPCTGLRFFTVYGPWGRPDMAYFLFTKAIVEGTPIHLFNDGKMRRDFTYIDDVIECVVRISSIIPDSNTMVPDHEFKNAETATGAPYKIYNLGNDEPVEIVEFLEIIEDHLGTKAEVQFAPMQSGDVFVTHAETEYLNRQIGFKPRTHIGVGAAKFVNWFMQYYKKD